MTQIKFFFSVWFRLIVTRSLFSFWVLQDLKIIGSIALQLIPKTWSEKLMQNKSWRVIYRQPRLSFFSQRGFD